VDEVKAAPVHQRAITGDRRDPAKMYQEAIHSAEVLSVGCWNEHPSHYISIHEQE